MQQQKPVQKDATNRYKTVNLYGTAQRILKNSVKRKRHTKKKKKKKKENGGLQNLATVIKQKKKKLFTQKLRKLNTTSHTN